MISSLLLALALTQSPSAVNGAGTSRIGLTAPSLTLSAGYITATKIAAPAAGTFDTCTGTLTASTTYYYRVSAINAVGETTAFTEASKATGTTGATRGVSITWTHAGTGVTGFKVYGRSTGAELLIATAGATARSYCDSGSLTPSGALPSANTTGTSVIDGPLTVNGALTTTGAASETSYTATAGSGSNGFALSTNGARVDFGAGASDYASSDGTTVTFAGPVATQAHTATTGVFTGSTVDVGGTTRGARITGQSQGGTTNASEVLIQTADDATGAYGTAIDCLGNSSRACIMPGGLKMGSSGSLITASYSGTAVIDFGSTSSTCVASSAVTVTGAALGDQCVLGISADMTAINGNFTCEVTGSGTAKVVFCAGSVTQDPASATYTVRVFH